MRTCVPENSFVTVDHPETGPVEYLAPAVLTTSGRAEIRRPAPRLGEHNDEVLAAAEPLSPNARGNAGTF